MITYFIPHKNSSNPQHLIDAGLEMLLRDGDDTPKYADLNGTGPGDLPGQLISWAGGESLAYLPERQDWIPALPDPKRDLPAGRYWIGKPKGQLPDPMSLARNEQVTFDGLGIELGDGNLWVMPNALRFPHYLGFNAAGEYERFPIRNCIPLYERTLWALEHAQAVIRGEADFDMQTAFHYVIEMLAVNYRVCPHLVSMLQLFNDSNLFLALSKTTDVEQLLMIREELKKNSSV
tara:strand:- start:16341 stop:17042 length:702 start_codon:yes stop_codon:yes gene_type:complete